MAVRLRDGAPGPIHVSTIMRLFYLNVEERTFINITHIGVRIFICLMEMRAHVPVRGRTPLTGVRSRAPS